MISWITGQLAAAHIRQSHTPGTRRLLLQSRHLIYLSASSMSIRLNTFVIVCVRQKGCLMHHLSNSVHASAESGRKPGGGVPHIEAEAGGCSGGSRIQVRLPDGRAAAGQGGCRCCKCRDCRPDQGQCQMYFSSTHSPFLQTLALRLQCCPHCPFTIVRWTICVCCAEHGGCEGSG